MNRLALLVGTLVVTLGDRRVLVTWPQLLIDSFRDLMVTTRLDRVLLRTVRTVWQVSIKSLTRALESRVRGAGVGLGVRVRVVLLEVFTSRTVVMAFAKNWEACTDKLLLSAARSEAV